MIYRRAVDLSKLASIELETVEGDRVTVGTLWQDKTVILAFLRHFG